MFRISNHLLCRTTEILAQVKEAVLSIDEEDATTTHSDALATPFSNA
jgi:hypothetical protein